MSATIRFAIGDLEHSAAYRLRSKVFGGEGILDRDPEAPLFDVFDTLPSSRVVVAMDGDHVVGTVRATWHGNGPAPCDEYFDAADALPSGARVGSGSLLCVEPSFRSGRLGLRLVEFTMRNLYTTGRTHGVAPIRPEAVPIFRRLGWWQLGPSFVHPIERVPVVTMGVEFADYFGWRGSSRPRENDRDRARWREIGPGLCL